MLVLVFAIVYAVSECWWLDRGETKEKDTRNTVMMSIERVFVIRRWYKGIIVLMNIVGEAIVFWECIDVVGI